MVHNAHKRQVLPGLEIDHIDEDARNHRSSNLRMVTHKNNLLLHKYKKLGKDVDNTDEHLLWKDGLIVWDDLPNAPSKLTQDKEGDSDYTDEIVNLAQEAEAGIIWQLILDKDGEATYYSICKKLVRVCNNISGRVLRVKVYNQGYPHVTMFLRGKYRQRSMHRLVGTAFVYNPNPDEYYVINHDTRTKATTTLIILSGQHSN